MVEVKENKEFKDQKVINGENMKQGWEIKKLGDIAYIGLGFTHTPEYVEKGVAFLSVKDISGGEICWDNIKYVSQEEYDTAPKGAKPNKGDILFCRVGTMGKPVIVDTDIPFCTFVSLGYLHIINNTINTYVKYWMQSDTFDIQVKANVKGVAIKNLNTGWLKEFTLPIPPLPEQEKIVAELDCLSGIIEKKKQQLKELDALAQSTFYTMFGDPITNEKGWDVVAFESVCNGMTKGPFGSDIKKSLYVPQTEDAYKVYIQANAIEKDLSLGTYYISKDYYDEKMYRFEVYPYDYLITCDGTLGKFVRLPENIEKGIISSSLLRLSIDEDKIKPKYFEYIWSFYMLPSLVKDVRNTALKHLPSAAKIGALKIPRPQIESMRLFEKRIIAIEKQKGLIKDSIEETETLFNARMQYYFG